jgi:hypothetical protein
VARRKKLRNRTIEEMGPELLHKLERIPLRLKRSLHGGKS